MSISPLTSVIQSYAESNAIFSAWDVNGNPLAGGQLYTYAAGTNVLQATYTDQTGTTANTNPVILNANGQANVYLTNLSYKFNLLDVNGVQQPGWPVDNTSAAALQSDINNLQNQFNADLTAINTGLAASLSPAGDTLIGVCRSLTGAVGSTLYQWMEGSVTNIFDFLTQAQQTAVRANTIPAVDLTIPIQNAINAIVAKGGGTIFFPWGTYNGNWTLGSDIKIKGEGIGATIFVPTVNTPVFATPLLNTTAHISIEDCQIAGNSLFTSQHGISLKATAGSSFIDSVFIIRTNISGCGGYGLYAYGNSAIGPYVSRLHLEDCSIGLNNLGNVHLEGAVFNTEINHCSLCEILNNTGTYNANDIVLDSAGSGQYPARVSVVNTVVSNQATKTAGNTANGFMISAGDQISFSGCSFAYCDPFINTTSTVYGPGIGPNISFRSCSFATGVATTNAFLVPGFSALNIEYCRFISGLGTLNNIVNYGTTSIAANVNNLNLIANTFTGSFLTVVNDQNTYYEQLASNTISAYRDIIYMEASSGTADTLNTLLDATGTVPTAVTAGSFVTGQTYVITALGTTTFTSIGAIANTVGIVFTATGPGTGTGTANTASVLIAPGREVTVLAYSTHVITVAHAAGNIYLNGATSYAISGANKSLTLRWNQYDKMWHECGRS